MSSNPHQHTREWWLARRGRITSSRVKTIVHGTPRGWLSLMQRLRAEELMDEQPPEENLDFVPAIRHGYEHEPVARANAELHLSTDFELVGFVQHPELEYIGCSSDFLAHERTVNGEIKCPMDMERHRWVYFNRLMPDEHKPQVQLQMAVHRADYTLFVSYHPKMPHWRMQTVIIEVPRDQAYIDRMLERCYQFRQQMLRDTPPPEERRSVPTFF